MSENIELGSSMPEEFPLHWTSDWGEDKYGEWVAFTYKGVRQVLRWIKPGNFMMGDPPGYEVILSKGFLLAETVCTQELWEVVMGNNPSKFQGKKRPVEKISWDDCQEFLNRINDLVEGLDLCLPTEAQWEYACRAGTTTQYSFGNDITKEQVNFGNNVTVDVKSLPSNNWGLYEMHGNVWEWCNDYWYSYYEIDGVVDPTGPSGGTNRVVRGGRFANSARTIRSAGRFFNHPTSRSFNIGIRLSRGQK